MTKRAFEDWYDISSEEYREYVSEDGSVYRIDNPRRFHASPVSRTHYVLDDLGVVHTLLASAFKVCRFLDRNGMSFTSAGERVRPGAIVIQN